MNTTSDLNPNLSGLGLRLHYDSRYFSNVTLSNVLATNKLAQQAGVADTSNLDGRVETDTFENVSWVNIFGATWPGSLPMTLYTVNFTLAPGVTGSSQFGFTASSTSVGYGFASPLVTVSAVPVPPAIWMLLSGLIGLFVVSRRPPRQSTTAGLMTYGSFT